MSGFDVQMRSDAMVQQNRQFYDEQGFQAQRDMVHGLRQSAGMAVEGIQMAQEMAMRQADADMRLQLQQQEFQTNAFKLQQMALIDQTDMTRLQVETQREQLKAMQMENERAKKLLEDDDSIYQEHMLRSSTVISRMGGPERAAAAGVYQNDQGRLARFGSDTERESYLQKLRSGKLGSPGDSPGLERGRDVRALKDLAGLILDAEDAGDTEEADRLRSMRSNILDSYPAAGRDTAGIQSPAGPTQPMGEGNQQQIQALAADFMGAADWTSAPLAPFTGSPQTKASASYAIGVLGEILVRQRGIKPEMARDYLQQYLTTHPEGMGVALLASGYSDARIAYYYQSVYGLKGAQLESVMGKVRAESERLQQPLRARQSEAKK